MRIRMPSSPPGCAERTRQRRHVPTRTTAAATTLLLLLLVPSFSSCSTSAVSAFAVVPHRKLVATSRPEILASTAATIRGGGSTILGRGGGGRRRCRTESLLRALGDDADEDADLNPASPRSGAVVDLDRRGPSPDDDLDGSYVHAAHANAHSNSHSNSHSLHSARQVRIVSPLAAILSAILGTSAGGGVVLASSPASALAASLTAPPGGFGPTAPTLTSSPEPSNYFASIRKYFPNSRPTSKLVPRITSALKARAVQQDQSGGVLIGYSFCTADERPSGSPPPALLTKLESGLGLSKSSSSSSGSGNKSSGSSSVSLGGPGGVPFVSPSSFDAFFLSGRSEHRPGSAAGGGNKERGKRHVVLVYGPHVTISDGGVLTVGGGSGGTEGRGEGGGCGPVLDALIRVKSERGGGGDGGGGGTMTAAAAPTLAKQPGASGDDGGGGGSGNGGGDPLRTVQESYLVKELSRRLSKVKDADLALLPGGGDDLGRGNAAVAAVTNAMYDIVSEVLVREVDASIKRGGSTFWEEVEEVTLLGGVVIRPSSGGAGGAGGAPSAFEEYFKPVVFQSMKKVQGQTFVVTDNLLSYLDDDEKKEKGTMMAKVVGGLGNPGTSLAASIDSNVSNDAVKGASIVFAAAALASGAVKSSQKQQQQRGDGSTDDREEKPTSSSLSDPNDNSRSKIFFGTTVRLDDASAATKAGAGAAPAAVAGRSSRQQGAQKASRSSSNSSRSTTSSSLSTLILALLTTATSSDRGQSASPSQVSNADSVIRDLELLSPVLSPASSPKVLGTWDLVYTDTEIFRSSPFCLVRRAACETGAQVGKLDAACKTLQRTMSLGGIGRVRQVVTPTELISEVHLSSNAADADAGNNNLESAVVSRASIRRSSNPTNNSPAGTATTTTATAWDVALSSVEVKGSNVPVVRQLLDLKLGGAKGELGGSLDVNFARAAVFETTYLDDTLRISRDEDGHVFVFEKVSGRTEPTNYDSGADYLGAALKLI